MITITRERLEQIIACPASAGSSDVIRELARIALASITAEPMGTFRKGPCGYSPSYHEDAVPLYAAPPAPVSVPVALNRLRSIVADPRALPRRKEWISGQQYSYVLLENVEAMVDDACRAAMLQGADGTLTNEGTIPVTQFKPVADLYGLTSPTGGETSFTFDAVEARDFIDGGWSCQEYVELERFQEAITNHTEDKLAMVDHSGDSNNMVEPVTTANKLPFDQWLSQQTGTIDVECGCVMTEVFFHWLRVAYEAGNYPVIPDGYVVVPKRLTAENGAKSVMIGEFSETKFINCPECFGDDECETCDGSGRIEISVPVSWTNIKAIWAKGVEHFAAAPKQETL